MMKREKSTHSSKNQDIEQFYARIGLANEETRKYLVGLQDLDQGDWGKPEPVFIGAGATSEDLGGEQNAGLEGHTY